jgi:Cu(I)/Ag(I) efflux system membrane fusion protein/cobalt-zinc-cadmium efflux system membrane fusion protein
VIPAEAVIRSGERNIVFVTRDKNKFTPRDVTLGPMLDDGMIQILAGLAPGEVIVTSGQFLLDSESKLKEAVQKMRDATPVTGKAEEPEEALVDDTAPDEDFFEDLEADDDFFIDLED